MQRYEFNGHLHPTPPGMVPIQMSGPVYLASEVEALLHAMRTDLILLAAKLVRGDLLPPIDTDKWYRSTPLAERRQITEAIEETHDRHKDLAMAIKALVDRAQLGKNG